MKLLIFDYLIRNENLKVFRKDGRDLTECFILLFYVWNVKMYHNGMTIESSKCLVTSSVMRWLNLGLLVILVMAVDEVIWCFKRTVTQIVSTLLFEKPSKISLMPAWRCFISIISILYCYKLIGNMCHVRIANSLRYMRTVSHLL